MAGAADAAAAAAEASQAAVLEDMDMHQASQLRDPLAQARPDAIRTERLDDDQLSSIRELDAYWSSRGGTLEGRTWKQQLSDKIKQLYPAIAINANVEGLRDRLLCACLTRMHDAWESNNSSDWEPEVGDDLLFTPGPPFQQHPALPAAR